MACYSGPKIAKDGLVFHYDMHNTKKSWLGKPSTNFFTNGSFRNGSGIVQEGGSNPTNTIIYFPHNPGNSSFVLQQTGSSVTEYQINLTTELKPSTTYCMSGWFAASLDHNGIETFFHSRAFSASGAHVGLGVGLYNVINTRVINGLVWKYCYATITTPADYSNGFNWYIGYGSTNTTGRRYYTNIQMEEGTYPSRYVDGTRSNTQAILDLTNKNSITANSLTYNSDGAFSFNGSSDYLSLDKSLVSGMTQFSYSIWFKTSIGGNLINEWNGGANFALRILNGKFDLYAINPGWNLGISANITDNRWHYATVTLTNSLECLYLDGVLIFSTPCTNISTSAAYKFKIGANADAVGITGGYFTGLIGVVQVYNRALSATEIKHNFEATRSRYGV